MSVIDRHGFSNTPSAKYFSSELTYVTLLLILLLHMVYCKVNLVQLVPRIFQSFRLHIQLTRSVVITKLSL